MQRNVIPDSFKEPEKLFLNDLMDEMLGQIIIVTSDPTTLGGELQVNQMAFNISTLKLFININGIVFSFAATQS